MKLTIEDYKYFFLSEKIPNTVAFVTEELQEKAVPYFLNLYNPVYNCFDKLHSFELCLAKHYGLKSFLAYKEIVRGYVVKEVKKLPAFQKYDADDFLDRIDIVRPPERENKGTLYNKANHRRWFVSIDIVQANFSSLKFYNRELVLNKNSYEDFLREFTGNEYLIHSRQFRNDLLKLLNPAHFSQVQRLLSDLFFDSFARSVPSPLDIVWGSDDETVISIDNLSSIELLHGCENVKALAKDLGVPLRLNVFQLKALSPINAFVRENLNNPVEFKCVKPHLMPQVYKHYFNLPLDEMDLQVEKPGTGKKVGKLCFEK